MRTLLRITLCVHCLSWRAVFYSQLCETVHDRQHSEPHCTTNGLLIFIARLKRDGTRAETRFGLSAKRTSLFKSAGCQFSRLLAAELCASTVVMVVMLGTPCSVVQCKTTGYPLHSRVSPSIPLPCVTVCHQVSTELY